MTTTFDFELRPATEEDMEFVRDVQKRFPHLAKVEEKALRNSLLMLEELAYSLLVASEAPNKLTVSFKSCEVVVNQHRRQTDMDYEGKGSKYDEKDLEKLP